MRGLNPSDQLTDGQYGMASMRGGAPGGGRHVGYSELIGVSRPAIPWHSGVRFLA
jgi:hypothetical protein